MSRFFNIGKYWQDVDLSVSARTADILMQAGVSVFPCREGGPSAKAPYTQRGFFAASTDPLDGGQWSLMFPNAVWGLPCALNNVLAIDADRHGKGDGVANIFALFEKYQFDWRTLPVVATPNAGYHFYFGRPATLGQTRAKLCDAVDIRDNAYVIAPGSMMADGCQYRLLEGTVQQFGEAIAARCLPYPPAWMLPMLVRPSMPKRPPPTMSIDDEALKNQIHGIINKVLGADEGNRNNLLYWMACRFGEMVLADILALEVAEILLDKAGSHIGLSAREIRATAISGLRKILEGDHDER